MEIQQIVSAQKEYFAKGVTKNITFRLNSLIKLQMEIKLRQNDILAALQQDLGKVPYEGYMTEVATTLEELAYILKNLKKWARDKRVKTPLAAWPGKSFIRHEPYGVALIMAPWNYPFMLSMEPLIGAIAGGNCAILKPSAYAPKTSAVLKELCDSCFAPSYVTVVEGGREQNNALLEQRFDYIFFTGSVEVGKLVMESASRNLTPVSLELGGKSPCIVDESANLKLAGRRIAFGKYLNAGQTCVAPDYLLVQQDVLEPLLDSIQDAIQDFFGDDPMKSTELPKIVNEKHFNRLLGLMKGAKIYYGGHSDKQTLRIEPTVLLGITPQSPVMQEEVFGPVLPVLTYDKLDTAINFVNSREKPLALYMFSTQQPAIDKVLEKCSYGGGCINDTILHLATTHMGFGGVGQSGMGQYHGKASFDTFTHKKSVLHKSNWFDINVRYHPYTKTKEKLLHKIMK